MIRSQKSIRAARFILGVVGLTTFGTGRVPADPAPVIPAAKAWSAVQERQALCDRDAGKLWGHDLCGPLMFVDPATRQAIGTVDTPGAEGDGKLFRFALPDDVPIANTAVTFQGRRWSMVRWPLPDDRIKSDILLLHESYHRIQPDIGLTGSGGLGDNGHLDTRDGRIWLRGELHALRAALHANTRQATKTALLDALRFRVYRHSLWPDAAKQEQGLELNEGLAESTGIDVAIADRPGRIAAVTNDIAKVESNPSFVRSFAYATGPAYAELLNRVASGWRRRLDSGSDLGRLAARAWQLDMPAPNESVARQALNGYGGAAIAGQEDARAKRIAARNARYAKRFLNGPVLILPLEHFSISFDPRAVNGFDDHGSVYGTVKLGDAWGKLTVTSGGALISPDFSQVVVPVSGDMDAAHPSGPGWTLVLAPHYELESDADRPGLFRLIHVPREQPTGE